HESSAWNLARHVEVHRVVTELSTLPHLVELNSLDLNLLESLADYHVAAEPVALGGRGYRWRWRRRKGGRYRVSVGIDTNAAGQQRHCRASVNRRPASRRLSTSDLAQTVNRRVMWKLQRRREGHLSGAFHRVVDAVDLHLLGMPRQIVGRGDDDVVVHLPVHRFRQYQRVGAGL